MTSAEEVLVKWTTEGSAAEGKKPVRDMPSPHHKKYHQMFLLMAPEGLRSRIGYRQLVTLSIPLDARPFFRPWACQNYG